MIGHDIIGTFNPSDLPEVSRIKQLSAELIDTIHSLENVDTRRKLMAIDNIEIAAMLAVKSIFSTG